MSVLSIDFGTSGAKASDGRTVSYPTFTSHPGHVEQRPSDWLAAFHQLVDGADAYDGSVKRDGTAFNDAYDGRNVYDAIVLTGQMQDLVYLDNAPSALEPDRAVLYSDTRSTVPAIPRWEEITGNLQGATSNVAMMHTLGAGRAIFSPAGYVIHALGLGEYVDPTTASTTAFLDIATRTWSHEVCAAVGVDPERHLPTIAQGEVGTYKGIPIILAPGDATTTALGIGHEHVYMGTTGWHARITKDVTEHRPEKHTLALGKDEFLTIAAVQQAGAARDEALRLFPVDGPLPREKSGVVAIPAFSGGRFPRRVDRPGATFVGVTAQTTPAHLHKAILEGVCLALSFDIDSGAEATHAPLPVVGGCTRSREWMQILSDVTGRTVHVLPDFDAGTVGALRFAGVDVPTPQATEEFTPRHSYAEEKERFAWFLSLM